jgi:hypothetical protein|tara:strand:- start:1344 stop:2075 length:732 start_codon:yes stop_codon:yes gene_type:complete
MISGTPISRAKKTAGMAVTYRAASGEMYGTCPDSCPLKPTTTGTTEIDRDYEAAVRRAVPRRGVAFLFTHFPPSRWAEPNQPGRTVFNVSADSLSDAARYIKRGVAAVAVVAADYWEGRASAKVTESDGVRMVRCPDELTGIGCARCGSGEPLCARSDRNYGIVFTAHGSGKRLAGDNDERGGCYAGYHRTAHHWRRLSECDAATATESDGEHAERFAAGLAPRSVLRHHVAGDIGTAPRAAK